MSGDLDVPSLATLAAHQFVKELYLTRHAEHVIAVPQTVGTLILTSLKQDGMLCDETLGWFGPHNKGSGPRPTIRTPISYVDLSNCGSISSHGLLSVCKMPLLGLDMSKNSWNLSLWPLSYCASTLTSLNLSKTSCSDDQFINLKYLSKLKSLDASGCSISRKGLLSIPTGVEYLNLSNTETSTDDVHVGLGGIGSLTSINLSDTLITYEYESGWSFFANHKDLRSVDIGDCVFLKLTQHQRVNAETFFDDLCTCTRLEILNLSLNVISPICASKLANLKSLKVLGIMDTSLTLDEVPLQIEPAIAAQYTRKHVMVALKHFAHKTLRQAEHSLRAVLSLFVTTNRNESGTADSAVLDDGLTELVLSLTEKFYETDILCAAVLYYLTSARATQQSQRTRRKAVRMVFTLVHRACDEINTTLLSNCCLMLRNFRAEELAEYSCEMASALLRSAMLCTDPFVRTVSLHICCTNLAIISTHEKWRVGQDGAIDIVLQLIGHLHLEVAALQPAEDGENSITTLDLCWTFLWNVTDECPNNVKLLIDLDGVSVLLKSLNSHGHIMNIRRNVMGLVANMAEVQMYCSHLMIPQLMYELEQSLSMAGASLEVTYNVIGIFCRILALGEGYWRDHGLSDTRRRIILKRISEVVSGWETQTEDWINYRSLKPIIMLLDSNLEPEIHMWATWALYGLCIVQPAKYTALCIEEGALDALYILLGHPATLAMVRVNCSEIIKRCRPEFNNSVPLKRRAIWL